MKNRIEHSGHTLKFMLDGMNIYLKDFEQEEDSFRWKVKREIDSQRG